MDNSKLKILGLGISIDNYLNKYYIQLVNKESSKYTNPLFSTNDLPNIIKAPWLLPLVQNDHHELLRRISDDQLMVVIYFYLQDHSSSAEIMFQWFIDAGCPATESSDLIRLLHLAQTSKEDLDIDITGNLHYPHVDSTEMINLSSILLLIKHEQPIHWTFDALPENISEGYKKINLKNLNESAFLIEDHSCIVIGFSNNFTSFIELFTGYNSNLMEQLCKLVPLHYRDIYSLGRLFIECKELEEIIIKSGMKEVQFFGLDDNGKLMEFKNKYLIQCSNYKIEKSGNTSITQDILRIIPLYAKFIK